MIDVYTDGGCWGNPGPGAWAFVILHDKDQSHQAGAEKATTNNRMELTAVIRALEHLEAQGLGSDGLRITTDSQYVKNGINEWIHNWLKNSWKTASKSPVKNKELWMRLWELNQKFNPEWAWVKGHAGHPENELCDQLVQTAIKSLGV